MSLTHCEDEHGIIVYYHQPSHSKKNRRKAEKKKYNLKEGSVYEDIALMTALADIVTNVDNMQSQPLHSNAILVTLIHVCR